MAGLAAIQTAKNLGAIVTAFDVRDAAAEQVESMGAKFLHVDFHEDGSAAGGYAKEMSKEWFAAADAMLLKECKTTDVIITTALIPGRPAPKLIKKNMVENMPIGGTRNQCHPARLPYCVVVKLLTCPSWSAVVVSAMLIFSRYSI